MAGSRGWGAGVHLPVWTIVALVAGLAVFSGLGVFTVVYGDGAAYLRDDPVACANCHVMQDHYDAWLRSSHRNVATCNDCHLSPHPVGKWVTKADNGFFHSLAFTTGVYPDPIRIKPRNARVTQSACLHCHSELVHAMLEPRPGDGVASCATCHASVGHAGR